MGRATLWWKFSLRAEYLHDDQVSDSAMRTERWRGKVFRSRKVDQSVLASLVLVVVSGLIIVRARSRAF